MDGLIKIDFDQGLVGNIAPIGGYLDIIEQTFGEAEGYGFGGKFEIRKANVFEF